MVPAHLLVDTHLSKVNAMIHCTDHVVSRMDLRMPGETKLSKGELAKLFKEKVKFLTFYSSNKKKYEGQYLVPFSFLGMDMIFVVSVKIENDRIDILLITCWENFNDHFHIRQKVLSFREFIQETFDFNRLKFSFCL